MERGFARGSNHDQLLSRTSFVTPSDSAKTCWQRSVKRKYNDVSFDELQGTVFGITEDFKGSCSPKMAQGTTTSKGHCQRASCSSREVPIRTSEIKVDQEPDEGCSKQSNHLHEPFSLTENEYSPLGDTQDAKPDIQTSYKSNLFPQKRVNLENVERSSQVSLSEEPELDSYTQSEVQLLKEALKSERKALNSLYIELEEERQASAIAANEAMAMIARLQEEKAAVLMEARQYRRVAEEREAHNQEAIAFLKETLLNSEDVLLALQDQMERYREIFLSIESGELEQGNFLKQNGESGLLFLEGGEQTSLSSLLVPKCGRGHCQNQTTRNSTGTSKQIEGEWECQSVNQELSGAMFNHQPTRLVTEGVRMNLESCFDDAGGCYDGKQVEDAPAGGDAGEGMVKNPLKRNYDLGKERFWERQRFERSEASGLNKLRQRFGQAEASDLADANMQQNLEGYELEKSSDKERNLENESVSILARVKRLEERFDYLGKPQVNAEASQNDAAVTCNLLSDKVASDFAGEVMHERRQWQCKEIVENPNCAPAKMFMEGWENSYHRGTLPMPNEGTSAETKALTSRNHRSHMHKGSASQEYVYAEMCEDSGDGVHDVYEVHCEVNASLMHHSGCVANDHGESRSQLENPDGLLGSALQEAEEEQTATMARKRAPFSGEPKGCGAEIDEKLSVEINMLDVKDVHKSMAEEGVQPLKARLQALESERTFMKQAIDSLRKENMELKLLQEIAQQLRELKGDVNKRDHAKETSQQDQLSLMSFLKGIFSFTGLQSSVKYEGSRFVCPFQKNSETAVSKQNLGGLFHLLEHPPQSDLTAFVTRGLKVRLPVYK